MTVTGTVPGFWESRCELANPVAVRGMGATLYDATCMGEGLTWDRRLMLMPVWQNGDYGRGQHDGLILAGENYADFHACRGPARF